MVHTTTKEAVMNVVIGVDPHKASHTAVAIDETEDEVAAKHATDTNFFQLASRGLMAPETVELRRRNSGDTQLVWSTRYAASEPIVRYKV